MNDLVDDLLSEAKGEDVLSATAALLLKAAARIRALEDETEHQRGHVNALRDQMQKAQEQRDEAYARIHALEADSARWQWTREQAQGVYDGRTVDWTSESTPEDLDAQVDAARALLEPKLSEPDQNEFVGGKFINAEEAAVAREAAARALLEPKP